MPKLFIIEGANDRPPRIDAPNEPVGGWWVADPTKSISWVFLKLGNPKITQLVGAYLEMMTSNLWLKYGATLPTTLQMIIPTTSS